MKVKTIIGLVGLAAFGYGIVRSKTLPACTGPQCRDSLGDVLTIGGLGAAAFTLLPMDDKR